MNEYILQKQSSESLLAVTILLHFSPVFPLLLFLLISHACWKLKMMLCPLWPRCQSCADGGIDQACWLPSKEIHTVKKVCLFRIFCFSLSLQLEENNVCHLRRTHQEAKFYFCQTWQRKVWRLEQKWGAAWSFEWHSHWNKPHPFKHSNPTNPDMAKIRWVQ